MPNAYSLSPLKHAAALYKHTDGDFTADLAWHLRHGVVYSGPDAFVMARPVCWHEDALLEHRLPRGEPDTWFVWMAVGTGAVRKALSLCPYPLKYAAWQRHGDARFRRYSLERITRYHHGKFT